jgi:hypothetical protein
LYVQVPQLQEFVDHARGFFEEASERYIGWLIVCQFEKITQFFAQVSAHTKNMPAREVQFYLKKSEFISVIDATQKVC